MMRKISLQRKIHRSGTYLFCN